MADKTFTITGAGGATFTVTTDPDNWYAEHVQRQLDSGEIGQAAAAPSRPAKAAPSDD